MNQEPPKQNVSTELDSGKLHHRIVLVNSRRDRRNPPAGMRGSIDVRETPGARPEVRISIEFPQMFNSRAHHRTIVLDDAEVARLLASERNGTFEFTIDDELA